jgi:UDP-N-acetylmuramate--alanine ligase
MSALAWVLHDQGRSVRGSDLRENDRTRQLQASGVPVQLGHDREHLDHSAAVVYSSAVPRENVELKAARDAHIPVLHRQELLARLIRTYRSIGVAGTHGKTTTSAMIAALLRDRGLDPTFVVGAPTTTLGERHARWGQGEWLVAEIDESDGYFAQLRPEIAVITNIGYDHLTHYGSEQALVSGFAAFASQSRWTILSAEDPHTSRLSRHVHQALTFGIDCTADLAARHVEQHRRSTRAELLFRGERIGELELSVPGRHNVANALAAMLTGHLLGLEFDAMRRTLRSFQLPERRFQILEENGIVVVDDYAHLPEQIEANLAAVRQGWSPRRVISVFQPHRYSRMSYMHEHFTRALRHSDIVLVTDIYPAFEEPIPGVDARSVVDALRRGHGRVHHVRSFEETLKFLQHHVVPGDFVIGFGPGDIWQVLHRLAADD